MLKIELLKSESFPIALFKSLDSISFLRKCLRFNRAETAEILGQKLRGKSGKNVYLLTHGISPETFALTTAPTFNEFHSAIASFVIKIIPTREKDLGICDDFVAPSQGNPDQIEHLATNGLKFLFWRKEATLITVWERVFGGNKDHYKSLNLSLSSE